MFESLEMSDEEFRLYQRLIYDSVGINFTDNKKQLLVSRLRKRLEVTGIKSYKEYRQFVQEAAHGDEFVQMLNVISTNKTDFFREPQHFEFLKRMVYPMLAGKNKIRIWSAASSSGEEPYTLGITLLEALGSMAGKDVKILATDISTKVLGEAEQGVYNEEAVSPIAQPLLRKYFLKGHNRWAGYYSVRDELRHLISFRRLNLMEPFPLKGQFDFIFCRNVMIYFDKPTREDLVNRLGEQLLPGGYLFIGNAESLSGLKTNLQYVQPAIYQRSK
ncbi:MAG: protein-glutamate O-methyltransferase [bacterium]|nr:protein-glutamate O-methyltransferase [bacterium]